MARNDTARHEQSRIQLANPQPTTASTCPTSRVTTVAATRARVTDAVTNTAASVQAASASSAPRRRYWRNANTADTTGPAGIELAMAVDATVTAVSRAVDTWTRPASSRRLWIRAKATSDPASAARARTSHPQRRWSR